MIIPHRIFYPDGTHEDTTIEVPDDYFTPKPHVYTALELAQQEITDRELATIEHGQTMTDLELLIITQNQALNLMTGGDLDDNL